MRFLMDKVALEQFHFHDFFGFPCESSRYYCLVLIYHHPLSSAIFITRQHITSSVYKIGTSFLTQVLPGHRGKEVSVFDEETAV
jgi:hypothetical protein